MGNGPPLKPGTLWMVNSPALEEDPTHPAVFEAVRASGLPIGLLPEVSNEVYVVASATGEMRHLCFRTRQVLFFHLRHKGQDSWVLEKARLYSGGRYSFKLPIQFT